MTDLIKSLVRASEKAVTIARTIREEKELFSLLVEEKNELEKNKRFYQDFKTLADVLIQQVVMHDVGNEFIELSSHIRGEENNKFTNMLGETVVVEVKSSIEETAALLAKVLDGNTEAANLLAKAVHKETSIKFDANLENLNVQLPMADLGIWIDPIDSTAEYISGFNSSDEENAVSRCGLQCVTVLLGVFLRSNGEPVAGIVNQPFYKYSELSEIWQGRCFWGVSPSFVGEGNKASNIFESIQNLDAEGVVKKIIMSSSESENLKILLQNKYQLDFAAGAGYKQLCVALGLVDAYILSKGTTYKWDCCGPHALLKSIGGGIVKYQQALQAKDLGSSFGNEESMKFLELKYDGDEEDTKDLSLCCNQDGLIAYRNINILKEVLALLQSEAVSQV